MGLKGNRFFPPTFHSVNLIFDGELKRVDLWLYGLGSSFSPYVARIYMNNQPYTVLVQYYDFEIDPPSNGMTNSPGQGNRHYLMTRALKMPVDMALANENKSINLYGNAFEERLYCGIYTGILKRQAWQKLITPTQDAPMHIVDNVRLGSTCTRPDLLYWLNPKQNNTVPYCAEIYAEGIVRLFSTYRFMNGNNAGWYYSEVEVTVNLNTKQMFTKYGYQYSQWPHLHTWMSHTPLRRYSQAILQMPEARRLWYYGFFDGFFPVADDLITDHYHNAV